MTLRRGRSGGERLRALHQPARLRLVWATPAGMAPADEVDVTCACGCGACGSWDTIETVTDKPARARPAPAAQTLVRQAPRSGQAPGRLFELYYEQVFTYCAFNTYG